MATDAEAPSLDRIRWQCRRGMLELDVMLRRFVDQKWTGLDDILKQEFELLLGYSDQQLQGWLANEQKPDREVREIVSQIRQTGYYPPT